MMTTAELLSPGAGLLVKLASIAVHVDEFLGPDGHPADKAAIQSLLGDQEVKEWLAGMSEKALAPLKRSA